MVGSERHAPPNTMPIPHIRASWTRMFLEQMRRGLPTPDVQKILDRAGAGALAVLDQASPLGWLEADTHMGLLNAARDVLGATRNQSFWRTVTRESFDRPIFRALVQGTLALFGRSPTHVLKTIPKGWGLITTACGEITVTSPERSQHAEMLWQSIPTVVCRTDSFATAWVGSIHALLDVTQRAGDVQLDAKALSAGIARYDIRWR